MQPRKSLPPLFQPEELWFRSLALPYYLQHNHNVHVPAYYIIERSTNSQKPDFSGTCCGGSGLCCSGYNSLICEYSHGLQCLFLFAKVEDCSPHWPSLEGNILPSTKAFMYQVMSRVMTHICTHLSTRENTLGMFGGYNPFPCLFICRPMLHNRTLCSLVPLFTNFCACMILLLKLEHTGTYLVTTITLVNLLLDNSL